MRQLAVLVLALVAGPCWAWESPRQAMTEFLKFETDGGRLFSGHWQTYITQYIAVPAEGYDEPGWDELTVVTGYKITNLVCAAQNECKARVQFSLYPTRTLHDVNVVSHDKGGQESVVYTIEKRGESWLLKPDFGSPKATLAAYRALRAKQK